MNDRSAARREQNPAYSPRGTADLHDTKRRLRGPRKLTNPKPAPKREETAFAEFWEDVHNSEDWVAHRNGYPLHSATPQGCTALPPTVAQCNPIIYRTTKDHPGDHNPPEAGSEMPGSFELAWTDFCPWADGRLPKGKTSFVHARCGLLRGLSMGGCIFRGESVKYAPSKEDCTHE